MANAFLLGGHPRQFFGKLSPRHFSVFLKLFNLLIQLLLQLTQTRRLSFPLSFSAGGFSRHFHHHVKMLVEQESQVVDGGHRELHFACGRGLIALFYLLNGFVEMVVQVADFARNDSAHKGVFLGQRNKAVFQHRNVVFEVELFLRKFQIGGVALFHFSKSFGERLLAECKVDEAVQNLLERFHIFFIHFHSHALLRFLHFLLHLLHFLDSLLLMPLRLSAPFVF